MATSLLTAKSSTATSILSSTTYKANVIGDGAVGYWRLDELTGTVAADSSANGNTGLYEGLQEGINAQLNLGITGALADLNKACRFISTGLHTSGGDVTIAPSTSINVAGPMSIEFWALQPVWSDQVCPMVSYDSGLWVGPAVYDKGFGLQANFGDSQLGIDRIVTSTLSPLSNNVWHHIVATTNGTNVSLYLNGVLAGSATFTAFTPRTNIRLGIAEAPHAVSFWNGSIDEVAIYNKELSADQVAIHYRGRLLGAASGGNSQIATHSASSISALSATNYFDLIRSDHPIAYYRMDDLSGTVLTDSSGNFNHGTISATGATFNQTGVITGNPAMRYVEPTITLRFPTTVDPWSSGDFTVEFWLKPDGLGWMPVIVSGDYLVRGFRVGFANAGYPEMWTNQEGGPAPYNGRTSYTNQIPILAWTHIIVTYSGNTVSIYQNGVLITSYRCDMVRPNPAGSVYVLQDFGGQPDTGVIDEVAIYNKALTTTQALAHYNMGHTGV